MSNLNKMSDEDFREILEELVGDMSTDEILSYGDIYSTLAEALNNEVIERWQERHPSPPELPNLSTYNIQPTWEEDEEGFVLILTLDAAASEQHLDYLLASDYMDCRETAQSIEYLINGLKEGWFEDKESGVEEPARFEELCEILENAAELGWEAVKVTDVKVREFLGE